MKSLPKEFIGRGEVRGFRFTQLKSTDIAFLYKIECSGTRYYEVFKKRKNIRFGNVSYPTSKAFGKWAWTFPTLKEAMNCFIKLNS